MAEKFRPSFLNPEMKVGPLTGDKYGQGSFTTVGNLENLPKNIKEKALKGYVIKQYLITGGDGGKFYFPGSEERQFAEYLNAKIIHFKFKEHHTPSDDEIKEMVHQDLFLQKELGGIKKCEELLSRTSIVGVAKELRHRNLIMKNYFAKSLPELVVPTQILIGKDEVTDKKLLYEIQPRLEGVNTVQDDLLSPLYKYYIHGKKAEQSNAEKALDDFITRIKNMFPEKINIFKHEITVFIKEISDLPAKEKHLPFDCAALANLLFTEHGLRLIDTNGVRPIPTRQTEDTRDSINTVTKFFNNSLKLLELIESKL